MGSISSKIYFSGNHPIKNVLRYVVMASTGFSNLVAPKFTEKNIRKVLVQPNNRPLKPVPDFFVQRQVSTQYGSLATFHVGPDDAPIILFTHGWSGSSVQFYGLMESVAEQGYHCVAFDHYAHHRSHGKESTFPLFIIGLQNIVDALKEELHLTGNLHCVVSHSMGVAGTVNVFHGDKTPHFFISPFFDFAERFYERVSSIGITKKIVAKIVDRVEEDYSMKMKNLEPNKHIGSLNGPIHIVHDPQDQFAKFSLSQFYERGNNNISLESLEDSGHMRIIDDERTKESLLRFLTSL